MQPTCSGHRPASTRKRLLLPDPLGPMMMTDRPGGTSNVSSFTSTVPSGAYSASLRCRQRASTSTASRWGSVIVPRERTAGRIAQSQPFIRRSLGAEVIGVLRKPHGSLAHQQARLTWTQVPASAQGSFRCARRHAQRQGLGQ